MPPYYSGTGYIGSFTALALLEAGYKVVITDNLYNSSLVAIDRMELICGKRPEFHNVDMTDEASLDKVFAAHPDIDSVIHFAALKVSYSHLYIGIDFILIFALAALCLMSCYI
jgi:UDP-glucose 4-epimerase